MTETQKKLLDEALALVQNHRHVALAQRMKRLEAILLELRQQ